MAKMFGYARVSTLGQSLEEQKDALMRYGVDPERIYSDKLTGTTMARPGMKALKAAVQKGDVIVTTKLDRLGRRTKDVLTFIDWAMDRGITLDIQNVGRLVPGDKDPNTKLLLTMIAAFAELERDMIVTRTQEGKAIARKRPGYREGRPRKRVTDKDRRIVEYGASHSANEAAEMAGISRATYYRIKKRVEAEAARKEG